MKDNERQILAGGRHFDPKTDGLRMTVQCGDVNKPVS
jgi:hypothetical protein